MPTDPFVAPDLDATPRQEPNLAPGVTLPAAHGWRPDRPGDADGSAPEGRQFGRPGPNVGYALRLVELRRGVLNPATHEALADAMSVVAELAMKRAAGFGRAPTVTDVTVAAALLGYTGETPPDGYVRWRVQATHGAEHEYHRRRAIVDAVPDGQLRGEHPSAADIETARDLLVRTALPS